VGDPIRRNSDPINENCRPHKVELDPETAELWILGSNGWPELIAPANHLYGMCAGINECGL